MNSMSLGSKVVGSRELADVLVCITCFMAQRLATEKKKKKDSDILVKCSRVEQAFVYMYNYLSIRIIFPIYSFHHQQISY